MYLVLKSCRADGVALRAGDIVELKESTAKALIDIGRVEVTTAKAEDPAEVVVEDRKEKPKRTRKAK